MTPDNTATDARIDELETRFALQDQTLQELGNEVYRQQREITRLEALVQQLAERVAVVEAGQAPDGPPDEIPPHY